MQVTPLKDKVFFKFLEPTSNTKFGGRTAGGIEIPFFHNEQAGKQRWVQITAVGPDVTTEGVVVGAYALIEAGRWSSAFKMDDGRHWQTKEEWVIALSDDPIYDF